MQIWNRQYRLSAGAAGQQGFEIGEGETPLHISFSCEKGDTESDNQAKISIWNLSPEHLEELEKPGCVVALRAGYGDFLPLIFAGNVTNIETKADGSDTACEIELTDNLVALRDTYISVCYSGKISCKKVIEDIAADMGTAVSYSYNAGFADLPNGFSYIGTAGNALAKMCSASGLSWCITNGVLQIKKPGDVMSREVYELSAESGLIGIPSRVKEDSEKEKQSSGKGWQVQYLMNGAIEVNDYVHVTSAKVTGYFRVYSIEITGDNEGDEWVCNTKLMEA